MNVNFISVSIYPYTAQIEFHQLWRVRYTFYGYILWGLFAKQSQKM